MKKLKLLLLFIVVTFGFVSTVGAQRVSPSTKKKVKPLLSPKTIKAEPKFTEAQLSSLRESTAKMADCPGAFPKRVAFSVRGILENWASSSNAVLTYQNIDLNEGQSWFAQSTFIVPCDGLYTFTLNTMKDNYTNDITSYLTITTGTEIKRIEGWAWNPQGPARTTGTLTVLIPLIRGQMITSWIAARNNSQTATLYYHLTGNRVAP